MYDHWLTKTQPMLVLKPSRGVVSIERTFENISSSREDWGYILVVRMGRLQCPYTQFSLRATVIVSSEGRPVRRILTLLTDQVLHRNPIVEAYIHDLLPAPDMAYTLRLGRVNVPVDVKTTVLVKLDVYGENDNPHAGFVRYYILPCLI
jgi:hypothetical protein